MIEASWLANIRTRVEQPANHLVLVHLRNGVRAEQEREERETPAWAKVKRLFVKPRTIREPPLIAPPDAEQWLVHPEITERVWHLGTTMPIDCRALVCGAPALLHPQTGVIFVYGVGTVYFLRLTLRLAEEAVKAGAFTMHRWTFGGEMDIRRELGNEWVGGRWLQNEPEWCIETYREVGSMSA